MTTQIIVNVDVNGETTVTAKEVKGSGCQALTKDIEAAIGRKTSDQKTSEFYQSTSASAGQQAKANQ